MPYGQTYGGGQRLQDILNQVGGGYVPPGTVTGTGGIRTSGGYGARPKATDEGSPGGGGLGDQPLEPGMNIPAGPGFDHLPGSPLGGKGRRGLGRFLKRQGALLNLGYGNLADILASRGHVDPALLNRELRTIERGATSNAAGINDIFAGSGFGQSALSAALQGAAMQGGAEAKGAAIERENAAAAERYRRDLSILQELLVNPRLAIRGQNKALAAAKAAGKGSKAGGLSDILGGLGGINWQDLLKTGSGGGKQTDPDPTWDTGSGGYGGVV